MNIKKIVVTALVAVMMVTGVAFASQPFADVPADGWAMSAVRQLAAKGIVVGYPDGQFKGDKSATRYEVASMVARAYKDLDETKADKKDVELLKKLMVEFKSELDALGVKVDKIDGRVQVLENGIGKWQLSGNLTFDVRENSGENSKGLGTGWSDTPGSSYWGKANAYLNINKQIDEKTQFVSQVRFGEWASKYSDDFIKSYGKGDTNNFALWKFYVKTELPVFKGTNFTVGRFDWDFEDKAGLVSDSNAIFGSGRTDGFKFEKVWNKADVTVLLGRNSSMDYNFYPLVKTSFLGFSKANTNAYLFAGNLKYDFNDKFMAGLSVTDNRFDNTMSIYTLGVYGRAFLDKQRTMALKVTHYWQHNTGKYQVAEANSNSHTALRGTFSVSQDRLKYTSMLIEYANFSNAFAGNLGSNYQGINAYSPFNIASQTSLLNNKPINESRTDLWFLKFEQKFSKHPKWSTFESFAWADFNTTGVSNTKQWCVGVNYKLSPAIAFTLGYSDIDYGDGVTSYKGTTAFGSNVLNQHDRCILLRTDIKF